MQNQYVGDIGDYAKYSLLRALLSDYKLGVSWYLFPDEATNDGGHTEYLCNPEKWQHFDRRVFMVLKNIVQTNKRCISEIEKSGLFHSNTVFWHDELSFKGCKPSSQAKWRTEWFEESLKCLRGCDLIFADPDNGFRRSETFRPGWRKHAKSISECEARILAGSKRPVVIYHHSTRCPGGHDAEVRDWQERLGGACAAVRWRHISPRTFFILNCTKELALRAKRWCEGWKSPKVFFQEPLV